MKTPWTSQPQYAAGIDQSNPLTRGLIAAANPATGIDHVSGKLINFTGGAKRTVVNGEVCINTDGYTSSIYAHIDYPSREYTNMTMFALATPRTLGTNRSVMTFASTTDSSPVISLRSGFTTSSKVYLLVRNDSYDSNTPDATDTTLPAFVVGNRCAVAMEMTYNGGACKSYINGILDTQTTNTNASNGFTVNRLAFNALSFLAGNEDFWDGESALYLVWDRLLSVAEHASLAANPWQVFAPLEHWLPFLGSTPQLLAPTGRLAGSSWSASSGTTYSCVDEASPDDGDYAYTTSESWEEFTFDAPDSGHNGSAAGGYVRYRLLAGTGTVTVELRQSTTVLETWGPHTLTDTLQAFSQPITASTSNSSDLRIRFTADYA